MSVCPCGSSASYQTCCEPVHQNHSLAKQPEQLMRARYSAHVLKLADFVIATYHPSCEAENSRDEITESINSKWCKLEVISCQDGKDNEEGFVSFKAFFNDHGQQYCMQEKSRFIRAEGLWYYIDGVVEEEEDSLIHSTDKVGRNDPCPCGSGKKFKKCCH